MVFIPDRTPDDDVSDDAAQWLVMRSGDTAIMGVRMHVADEEPPEPDCCEIELFVGEEPGAEVMR